LASATDGIAYIGEDLFKNAQAIAKFSDITRFMAYFKEWSCSQYCFELLLALK
jgi:hypothetical protein